MNNVYYFTDIHGQKELFDYVINYIGPDSTLIFGGDACDRGDNGYYIMKQLLARPNTIYLKGNHEDIFVMAANEFMQHFPAYNNMSLETIERILKRVKLFPWKYEALQLCLYNGGKQTLIDWLLHEENKEQFVNTINNLPLTYSYNNLDFCHAGGVYQNFISTTPNKDSFLWDRSAFDYGWAPDRICIHGHTPVASLPKYYRKSLPQEWYPLKYCGDFNENYTGFKIDMDTAAFYYGRIFVLDCNNLIASGFYDEKIEKSELPCHNIKAIEKINL